MKRIFSFFLAAIIGASLLSAKNWCENLISQLNADATIDKTVAVKRHPESKQIMNATYDFRFSAGKTYTQVSNALRSHADEAEYFREKNGKHPEMLLRFTDGATQWSCRLQRIDKSGNKFLVSVVSKPDTQETTTITWSSGSDAWGISDEEINSFRDSAWKSAAKRQKKEHAKAVKRAREAAAKASRQAARAQEQAAKAQKQAQRIVVETQKQNRRHTITQTSVAGADKQAELSAHNKALRDAEAARKRRLGR